jgi:hypothetical protein
MRQGELCFDEPSVAPVATAEEVEWLVDMLKGKGWLTAAKLEAIAQGTKNDRKIRAIARAAAPGIVSYPGSPGYKLWSECTMEEINHCLNAWDSQIRDNTARRMLYSRAYHSRFRGGV